MYWVVIGFKSKNPTQIQFELAFLSNQTQFNCKNLWLNMPKLHPL